MALSRNKFAVMAIMFLFFFLTLLHSDQSASSMAGDEEVMRKMVLGSTPPVCVNKCMNCRPCEATLVIPHHKMTTRIERDNFNVKSSHEEDDSYYLLSWKCKCGNKVFHP